MLDIETCCIQIRLQYCCKRSASVSNTISLLWFGESLSAIHWPRTFCQLFEMNINYISTCMWLSSLLKVMVLGSVPLSSSLDRSSTLALSWPMMWENLTELKWNSQVHIYFCMTVYNRTELWLKLAFNDISCQNINCLLIVFGYLRIKLEKCLWPERASSCKNPVVIMFKPSLHGITSINQMNKFRKITSLPGKHLVFHIKPIFSHVFYSVQFCFFISDWW